MATDNCWAEVVTSVGTKDQWKAFVKSVSEGDDYSSTTVTLTADIEIAEEGNFAATYMAGTSAHPFTGTFDGQGHKITYTKTGLSENIHGLFRFINGATIKNLRTAGTLSSSGTTMGGIVGQAHGNITIANCESSVTLTRTGEGTDDATYGGIIGVVGDNSTSWTMTVKNCIYNGTITVNKSGSGIVGYVRTNVTLGVSYCLFSGSISYTTNTNIANFTRGSGVTLTGCYYLNNYNSAGTAVTDAMRNTGELAFTLNTGNTESVFIGQGNLNKSNIEAWPSLTTEATKKVLKTKISGMSTEPYVNPGGAVPNPCRFGLTGFKISDSDAYSLETMPAEGGDFTYGTSELKTTKKMYCVTLPADAITLMLPFNVTESNMPAGITAYDITYTSGGKVTATKVNSIAANKPVLINGTKGTKYKFASDTEATYSEQTFTNGALTGVFVDQGSGSGYNPIAYVPANSYVLQNGASGLGFYKVAANNTIKITSFRAYASFNYSDSGAAPQFLGIDFDFGGTTGIESVQGEGLRVQGTENYYNLRGQRVANPTKGLYIVNGKKVIIN